MMNAEPIPASRGDRASRPAGAQTDTHLASERREAARALMMHPVLTSATRPEELALVRRHAAALQGHFHTQLGYPLVVETGFARLVKQPLPYETPARGARRPNSSLLSPRAYTCLALLCAGMLAPGTGEQFLISAVVDQLRADAASVGINISDSLTDRRAVVVALGHLVEWGLLTETDGSVAAWGEGRGEALLSIHRPLLTHLLARPLANLDGPEALWEPDMKTPEQPRRDLRRKLAENPLIRRESLTAAEADVLSRERRDVASALDDLLGLTLEVRAEGALAYDDGEELTDLKFPGQGTTRQAALLLIDAVTDRARPTPGTTALVHGREVPGLLVPWPTVADELGELARRYARSWREDVKDAVGLQRSVIDLLTDTGLALPIPDGLVLHPASARYRPLPEHVAERARADAAPSTPGGDEAAGPDLFAMFPDPQSSDEEA